MNFTKSKTETTNPARAISNENIGLSPVSTYTIIATEPLIKAKNILNA